MRICGASDAGIACERRAECTVVFLVCYIFQRTRLANSEALAKQGWGFALRWLLGPLMN